MLYHNLSHAVIVSSRVKADPVGGRHRELNCRYAVDAMVTASSHRADCY